MTVKLFTSYKLGAAQLQNRVVMAPMTRSRSTGNVPDDLVAKYYGQRSSAGLIITEGTSPSPNGLGYARIPGIFSKKQTDSWRLTTEAVHAGGACIFMQLMHSGRVGSFLNLPPGAAMLAPSAVPMSGLIWTDSQGEQPYDQPREMSLTEINDTIAEYAQAARNAINAGFDGVEVHGANGYLITQFLDPGSNQRTDIYGGDAEKRNRFAIEVTAAVIAEVGAGRVGIRLSPHGVFNDMSGSYPGITEQYAALATEAGSLGLSYLHLVDHSAMGAPKPDSATILAMCQAFRKAGGGSVILSGGYDRERAEIDLQSGAADLIAFGRPFISNPDLVARLKEGYPLAEADQATFYSPGAEGYIDYPVK
jgi:N-ethylmaleimide reductase